MIKDNEPYLIEYNVRMGDPECQVILPRLKTDLVKLCINTVNNKLSETTINWRKEKSMTIVLCSKGYPGKYKKNVEIKKIGKIQTNKNIFIFYAGAKIEGKKIISNGGRVLSITSIGNSFYKIRNRIIQVIKKINWKGGFFRKDIGWRIIKNK